MKWGVCDETLINKIRKCRFETLNFLNISFFYCTGGVYIFHLREFVLNSRNPGPRRGEPRLVAAPLDPVSGGSGRSVGEFREASNRTEVSQILYFVVGKWVHFQADWENALQAGQGAPRGWSGGWPPSPASDTRPECGMGPCVNKTTMCACVDAQ